jgi:hypothetical protein
MSVHDHAADATGLVSGVSAGVAGPVAFFLASFRSSSSHGVLRFDIQVSVNVPLKSSASTIGASHAPAFCSWNSLHQQLELQGGGLSWSDERENGRVAGRGRSLKDRPRGAGRDRGPKGARERRGEGERRAQGRAQEEKWGEGAEAL